MKRLLVCLLLASVVGCGDKTIVNSVGMKLKLVPAGEFQKPAKSRLDGYVGGPYKVIAADFTGDKFIDVILGYHAIGVLVY